MLKADLHIHTGYSPDCATPLQRIVSRCTELGINCIGITDHNTIAGALDMKRLAPFKVIVGEEIDTTEGEVIGYFLTEEVPKGLTPEETVRRIKKQGGLVCIPHPFDSFRFSAIRPPALERLLSSIDIIEVLNARLLLRRHVDRARRFAEAHGFLVSAGSDAHTLIEVGNAYVEMPEFDGKNEFLSGLAQGRIGGGLSSPFVHARSNWAKLGRALKGQ
ncbi:MAG: PHP-associated domain-containing protein [Chloroflexota bacterium]